MASKKIGLVTTTSLVLGNMVGSGVFLLPASLAPYGRYSLWGWGFSAGGAMLVAWVFSRLAHRDPKAGGPYAYTRAGFGDFMGFLVGWGYWISIIAADAALAVAMASYLSAFVPALSSTPLLGASVALGAVWLLTAVNGLGIRAAGSVQLVTTILKLTPLLVLAFFGIAHVNLQVLASGTPASGSPVSAVNACLALTLWAFVGLESATVPAEKVHDPERTIPRATLLGTAIAAFFYIVCTTVVMSIIPAARLATSNAPFADAARMLWGDWAGYLIAATAAISCFGALNGWVLMAGELPRAVAKDRLFPSAFARESGRGVAVFGLVLGGGLTTAVVLMNYQRGLVSMFTFIILLSTLSTVVPYLFCSMAEIVLSRRDPIAERRPIRDTVLAAGAFLFAIWAVEGTGPTTVYWGFLLLLAGVPVYVWQTGRRTAS
jgi:basic amino acid/polyamine antiporter, APA family